MNRLRTRLLAGTALLACAAFWQVSCRLTSPEDNPRHKVFVPYTLGGDLFWVRADGRDNARLRKKEDKPPADPEDKAAPNLCDAWVEAQLDGSQELIAAIRAINHDPDAEKDAKTREDQLWELVILQPGTQPSNDVVLYRSRNKLRGVNWSPAGGALLCRELDLQLVVWRDGDDRARPVAIENDPVLERKLGSWCAAAWMSDEETIAVAFRPRGRTWPVALTVGFLDLDGETACYSTIDTWFSETHRMTRFSTNLGPYLDALLGPDPDTTFWDPVLCVSPDGFYTFNRREKEGHFPRGWLEGVDHTTGEVFEVRMLWTRTRIE